MNLTRSAIFALAAAATGLPALAAELNLPARKAGEWKIEIHAGANLPPIESRMCLDPDTDRKLMAAGLSVRGDCSRMDVAEADGGYVIDSECTFGPMTTKSHTLMTGDFQSSYKIEIASDIAGGPKQMPPHSVITQTATWSGPCTDLTPGQMEIHGMKIDALKVLGGG